ncbi:hypothetical protein B566_EDAN009235 [Ephemera danica]|nr:hypothetical protein B566_EDAN009235 [Ephemera danica]
MGRRFEQRTFVMATTTVVMAHFDPTSSNARMAKEHDCHSNVMGKMIAKMVATKWIVSFNTGNKIDCRRGNNSILSRAKS